MNILDKHIDFVNEQVAFHKSCADRYKDNKFRYKKHLETVDHFTSLLEDIRQVKDILEGKDKDESSLSEAPRQLRLSLTPDDLEGLPEELLNELSITSADKAEFTILNILEESVGVMSLDQILVELYKKTGDIFKRNTITSRLYRMVQKNLLYSVQSKKGVYSLNPMSKEDIEIKFGNTLGFDSEDEVA